MRCLGAAGASNASDGNVAFHREGHMEFGYTGVGEHADQKEDAFCQPARRSRLTYLVAALTCQLALVSEHIRSILTVPDVRWSVGGSG